MEPNVYYNEDHVQGMVGEHEHRLAIGSMWDEIGRLQLEFLVKMGLTPTDRVLDVGCGCLRAGVRLVEYLDSGHYYGIDISQALLDVGYDVELRDASLQHKLPRENLYLSGDFDATGFGVRFPFGIAQSVFTHLPPVYLKLCLTRLRPVIEESGALYATFFLVDAGWSRSASHSPGGVITSPTSDPYHYEFADLQYLAEATGWTVERVGSWVHPRAQQMVRFSN